MFPDSTSQQQAQYEELERLKTIKQVCLILGILFSIIGLISMCDHPTKVSDDPVAYQIDQPQLDNGEPF